MRSLLLLCVFVLAACSHASRFPSSAGDGTDGIEFNVIPLDTRVDCDSVILKGTKRYAGSVFILPRLLVSVNKEGDTLFEVIPDGAGGYEFNFALYIPRTESDLDYRKNTPFFLHGCNIDAVMASLNNGKAKADQVSLPVRVPVKSIEISVDGIPGSYKIGGDGTTLLNYQGLDHRVSFSLKDKEALDQFVRRISGSVGIGIHAKVRFNARNSDGYFSADVDMSAVTAGVAAKLKGKVSVAQAELAAAIQDSVSSSSVKLYSEASNGEMYKKISEQITDMIFKQIASGKADDGSSNCPKADVGGKDGGDGTFQVAAALCFMRQKKTQHIEYAGLGENHEEIYETSSILKADVSDPDTNAVTLKTTANSYTYATPINAGDKFAIAPMDDSVESLDYKSAKQYYTSQQLADQNVTQFFPELVDTQYKIVDVNMPGVGVLARSMPNSWWNYPDPVYDVWGSYDLSFVVAGTKSVDHDYSASAGLAAWPVRVRFPAIGGRTYGFGDLVKDNPYWSGAYDADAGKLVLTAKQNLGRPQIGLVDTPTTSDKVSHYLFWEKRNGVTRSVSLYKRANELHAQLPTSRRVVKLHVGVATPNAAPPALVPKASEENAGIQVPKQP